MSWAQSADVALFRLINQRLANPFLDWCMPFFSGNALFIPAVIILILLLATKAGPRGRVFVIVLLVVLALGDGFVINSLKHAISRPRPFLALAETHELVGRGESGGMPSSHTSTWFAATFMAYAFYRRSWWFMLPLACLVGFSRIYVGAHYPTDVLAGAVLGAGYAAAGLFTIQLLWCKLGPKWFPREAALYPSLLWLPAKNLPPVEPAPASKTPPWLTLGYVFIFVVFVARLLYIASAKIELSEDEAYQWLWSKHLALSYFSKPPFIAYAQFVGTSLFGDNELGVRFFAPTIAALISLGLLRFFAREVNPRAGFWLVVCLHCTPLLAVGSTLMTIDPLLVLFWTAGMIAGWRACQPTATARDWVWVGLAIGAGFLSKYSALYEIVCLGLFFGVHRRDLLRQPGPYLALALALLCTIPVIIWNSQHGWITLRHVSENAGLNKQWKAPWRYVGDFVASETFLLNPIFLVAAVIAGIRLWNGRRSADLRFYLFWMSAPVLIGHLLYTFHSRVFPN